jgi:selenocysteine-specific elongation factor
MILGTAGHIDHGKTALVRALTGVDTDRLPEEKRRGITIDLGFAPLRLDDGTTIGVVDVPGHEAFVRTMLAGATGIDVALLVIAADEGPMPQTREHLAILELLHVRKAIVALTKSDLVDAEWLSLVTEEVRDLLADTAFAGADIIATSVIAEHGLDELRAAIARLATQKRGSGHPERSGGHPERSGGHPERSEGSPFRLPVDRAFTVRGTGTVVTGTVWSGGLAVDDTVRIMPDGVKARVRGLQHHGKSVDRISAGQRAAVALAGVDTDAVSRSATLITRDDWPGTTVLRADVTLLADAPELRPRTTVRFHLATTDVGARVVAAGTPLAPGTTRSVRVVLEEPVLARGGDRFVLRRASPLATIGGGVVTDAAAPRRARPMPAPSLSPEDRLALVVSESGLHGVDPFVARLRVGLEDADGRDDGRTSIIQIGDRLYSSDAISGARTRLLALVSAHHVARPLETGAPRQAVRSRLGIDGAVFDRIVDDLVKAGAIVATGAELRARGFGTELSAEQEKISAEILESLDTTPLEPPSLGELEQRFGPQTSSLLRHLERQGRLVHVEDTRYYTPDAVRELLGRLERGMQGRGELAPTDLREVLGFSRKFLIPFLEYCDRKGYTVRQGNGRIWRGARLSS